MHDDFHESFVVLVHQKPRFEQWQKSHLHLFSQAFITRHFMTVLIFYFAMPSHILVLFQRRGNAFFAFGFKRAHEESKHTQTLFRSLILQVKIFFFCNEVKNVF